MAMVGHHTLLEVLFTEVDVALHALDARIDGTMDRHGTFRRFLLRREISDEGCRLKGGRSVLIDLMIDHLTDLLGRWGDERTHVEQYGALWSFMVLDVGNGCLRLVKRG